MAVSRRAKTILSAAVLAGAAVGAYVLLRPAARLTATSDANHPPSFVAGQPEHVTAPVVAVPVEQQVDTLLSAWRGAIIGHDADTVMLCDSTFLGDPRTFTPALVKSAQQEGNERVRAFSTRVLGKFEDPTLIDVFRKLLEDGSPYVRENAAWGLGQLEARATSAAGDLEKARKHDKADVVRRAAEQALQRLHGIKSGRGAG
jgi:hypothetical protein